MDKYQKVNRLEEITEELDRLLESCQDGQSLTADEIQRSESLRAEMSMLEASLDSEKSFGRKTEPNVLNDGIDRSGQKPVPYGLAGRVNDGGPSIGALAIAAYQHSRVSREGGHLDPESKRILNAPTTVSTEGVGADGGFAVPDDFRTEIMQKVSGEDSLWV